MIFKQQMLDAILACDKTVTRRPVKYNRTGKVIPCAYKPGGGPGGTYSLQGPPEKGSKSRAKTIPGYRLRFKSIRLQRLGNITNRDARLEGFEDRYSFWLYWHQLYGKLDFDQKVWRIRFELVEVEG